MATNDNQLAIRALGDAVQVAGGQSAFQRLTGVRQQNVSNWLRKGQPLPAEHVLDVERSTGVSRYRLRPDIYPIDELSVRPNEALPFGSEAHS